MCERFGLNDLYVCVCTSLSLSLSLSLSISLSLSLSLSLGVGCVCTSSCPPRPRPPDDARVGLQPCQLAPTREYTRECHSVPRCTQRQMAGPSAWLYSVGCRRGWCPHRLESGRTGIGRGWRGNSSPCRLLARARVQRQRPACSASQLRHPRRPLSVNNWLPWLRGFVPPLCLCMMSRSRSILQPASGPMEAGDLRHAEVLCKDTLARQQRVLGATHAYTVQTAALLQKLHGL